VGDEMKRLNWLVLGFVVVLAIMGWFAYQKNTDDTHEGMSIIPEQHKDIPLYDGLKPTNHRYVIKGNHWKEIYDFYLQQLPSHNWNIVYEGTTLNDNDTHIDRVWGFNSRWRKEGFDGELWIWANYNQLEDQTEVVFDKTPIYNSTTWIQNVPSSICVYQSADDGKCNEINDKLKIEGIVSLINNAIEWKEERLPRDKTSVIDFGTINVKVQYGSDKEIYFVSEIGTKLMKPEPEFFELTSLSR
jgi:hypothetical protein